MRYCGRFNAVLWTACDDPDPRRHSGTMALTPTPPRLALLLLVAAGVNASKPPYHPEFQPNKITLHHDDDTFCGSCKWGNMDFDCDFRVRYQTSSLPLGSLLCPH